MVMKSYEVAATQKFVVEFDDEMFTVQEVLDSMEFTQFGNADVVEFVEGWTDYKEVEGGK